MSAAKQKGTRAENWVAHNLTKNGIPAERVPLSGSLGGKYSGDVVIGSIDHQTATIEIKHRESISTQLWRTLEWCDIARFTIGDHKMVVMMFDTFVLWYKGEMDPHTTIHTHHNKVNKQMVQWLDGNDYLAIKRNHYKPLIIMEEVRLNLTKEQHNE